MYRAVTASLTLIICLFSSAVVAEEADSEILTEAEQLVEIVPEHSKKVAQKFLTARTLTQNNNDQVEKQVSREETDVPLRTPKTSIKALQIIAKAKYYLGDTRGALTSAEQAEVLARSYDLPYLLLNVKLLKAELLWRMTRDDTRLVAPLKAIEEALDSKEDTVQLAQLNYRLIMLKGDIQAFLKQDKRALELFEQAGNLLEPLNDKEALIKHQINLGEFYLSIQNNNQALYQLLSAYWSAIANDKAILLADINTLLADLFIRKSVSDKALEHLSQAADFYGNYEGSTILSDVLKKMADIYYTQGKYNLALVHYFNILDSELFNRDIEEVIELRLDLAKTYLQLYNLPLAEQYLQRANSLITYADTDKLRAFSYLLSAELELLKSDREKSMELAESALSIGEKLSDSDILLHAYLLLTTLNAQDDNYSDAYKYEKKYNDLITNKQKQLLTISENDFREQRLFIEQSLHYKDQTNLLEQSHKEQVRFRYAASGLFIFSFLILIMLVRRGIMIKRMRSQLSNLYKDHYTHPRSGLRNFRLLNVKLPSSLEQSSAHFEQWKTGELINEPLHDKLRFVMVELPCLRTVYLQQGYKAGLKLEHEFGEFVKSRLKGQQRLYHFADGMFLYVEPNTNPDKTTAELFNQIQVWVSHFKPEKRLDRTIRAGIADYPFLPRAYTAINDKELIEILLMASNLARLQNHQHGGNQWVCLRAIENAPAASFAGDDIRSACLEALEKGLIKIDSSEKIEDNFINFSIID